MSCAILGPSGTVVYVWFLPCWSSYCGEGRQASNKEPDSKARAFQMVPSARKKTRQGVGSRVTKEKGGWGLCHVRGQGGLGFSEDVPFVLSPKRGGPSHVEESIGQREQQVQGSWGLLYFVIEYSPPY